MQISVESLSSIKKKISFKIPAEKVSAEVEKAYAEIRKHASVKGFRKGKVPMGLIEKHYGDKMADDVAKSLVNQTLYQGLQDKGLYPVAYPVIDNDELKVGEDFSYSATIEVYPEVAVKDYLGLEVKKEILVLDDQAVGQRLREMQESMAQLVPAAEGHAAQMGDFVTFDFLGSIDGVPFEGGKAEDFQLELGSGRFIPGFEDQMVGMTVGSEGTVKVSFPESYGAQELAGKPAEFAVTVKEIKVKELPELNDDFAKEFGEEFETLDALKAKLAEFQKAQEEQRVNTELRERVIKALVEKNPIEVPEVLVDRQIQALMEDTKRRLAQQRMSLEMMGLSEEAYKVQFRDVAKEQVKGSIVLDAVADKEKISVTEEDIAEQLKVIAEQAHQDLEKITSFYQNNERAMENLKVQMKEDKATLFVVEKAKVTEVAKEELNK